MKMWLSRKEKNVFKVKECRKFIKNLFTNPEYTELKMSKLAYIKAMCYSNLADEYEITGFGKIENGVITDLKIIRQTVRTAEVDATDEAIQEFMMSIPFEEIELWKLDWHSHVDMATFISTTDAKNYELRAEAMGNIQLPVMIWNKSGEYTCKCFIHSDKAPDIKITFEEINFTDEELDEIYDECKADVEEFCTAYVPKYTYNYGKNNKNNSWNWQKIKNAKTCSVCGCELSEEEQRNGVCDDCATQYYWGDYSNRY